MKRLMLVALVMVAVAAFATSAFAGGKTGPAGKSNIGHLELYAKECQDPWSIVPDGSGKMKYNLSGPTLNFVMNGHGLVPGEDYTLIYYPDPWPGNGLMCLGSDIANGGGNVHIAESINTGDLPIAVDANAGAKIWLVLSGDVDCDLQYMVGWHCTPGGPSEYLFEYDLITFDDTDE